jgi:MFS family permease
LRARLPAAVYLLGLTSLLNDAASDMIYPMLPVFLTGVLGAGAAALGEIEGAAEAVASLLKLAAGYASDRARTRKPLVVTGYVLASAVRPLIAFARSVGGVLAIRLIDRFGKGVRSSPRDALIADVVPAAARGRAFGVHQAMDDAGAVLGPLATFVLLAVGVSLRSVFLVSAGPALLACLVLILLVREPARAAEPVVAPVAAAPRPARTFTRPFWGYLAAITLFSLGNSSDAFLLLRAKDAGLRVEVLPLLWALHNGTKAIATSQGGALADRFGRRRAVALGWLVYAAVYFGFARATSAPAIVALFVLYAVHFALTAGAQKALVADLVPAVARASGFGAYNLCVGLALLPASVIFGRVYQRFGAGAAFGLGAALALAGIAVLPLSRPRGAVMLSSSGSG